MANIITIARVLCSIALLLLPTFSAPFYGLYITAGISDMLDGFIARKTATASELGALLDSIADVIFVAVCLIKILPVLQIQRWLWVWLAVIALIKLNNLAMGLISRKKLVMPHTQANKITGLFLFVAPLFMRLIEFNSLAILLCVIATFAAIEEGYVIIKAKYEYVKLF